MIEPAKTTIHDEPRILAFPGAHDGPKKRRRVKLPDFLRAEDWDRLISAAASQVANVKTPSKNRAARRDELGVHIGLYCGLRVSEICDLNTDHIDLDGRRLFVCEGKGGKDRYVAIPLRIIDRLREWVSSQPKGPLFTNEAGRRIRMRTMAWRVSRLGDIAKLSKHLHCHLLRHSYAMKLLQTGADVREIQSLLGHQNLQSTAQYLHCDTSKLQSVVDRL